MNKVYIIGFSRTAMGSFLGSLSSVSAPHLGATAIKSTLKKNDISPDIVDEVFMGNVLQAGVGQAPARQAALLAGISSTVPSTTVNKVCASGMKAVIIGAQSILAGDNDVVIAGGMENMSMAPHYLDARPGKKLGNINVIDGLVHDGLTNVYDQKHMGTIAEKCARDFNISRNAQDAYAQTSYERAAKAWKEGKFTDEVCSVSIPQRRGEDLIFDTDEEFSKVKFEKIPQLKPAFEKDGTVTAANASTINDGAAALILASEEAVKKHNLKPVAEILSYSDAARSADEFTIAPADAANIALKKAGLSIEDVDFWEVNEAFSVVSLANCELLSLPTEKVNVYGGAVALGHPLGCSGARIIVTLLNILNQENGTIGGAAICNGGGGASGLIVKKL